MMQAQSQPSSRHGQAGRGPAGGATPGANLTLTERARLAAVRRSTPDSEALASSDEEHDLVKSTHSLSSNPGVQYPSARRTSWLSEIQSGLPRRPSVTTTTSNTSQPATPSSEHGPWSFGSQLGRVASNPATANWSSGGLWGIEHRRDPSSRLASVPLQHHGVLGSSQARNISEERTLGQSAHSTDLSIPFSIPLQPTPKTYRSQSYSVGQIDEEDSTSSGAAQSGPQVGTRPVPTAQQALLHRPSRPSMLSEVTEGLGMAALHEENDDDPTETDAGVPLNLPIGKMSSPQTAHPYLPTQNNTRWRIRASTTNIGLPAGMHSMPAYNEAAIDDNEDLETTMNSSMHRFGALPGQTSETARRGQWQTSLGFGDFENMPQSRRHSLAEIPTRRNSLSAAAANEHAVFSPAGLNATLSPVHAAVSHDLASFGFLTEAPEADPSDKEERQRDQNARNYAATYFSGIGPATRSRLESVSRDTPAELSSQSLQLRSAPPQGLFARPGQDTKLYIVSFKCARADVYFVAENTGLDVKEGDLVMVEADRGHDLGTVLYAKVGWAKARELKEKANEEHYRWLMMFSRHNQTPQEDASGGIAGMMATSASTKRPQHSSSMGPSFGTGLFDLAHGSDLKPKMIKRLAQQHEIATLRDKEGNEAKAKRICQQKVNEHKLDMEVLDAEFQMDWKKLTFFYYANSYVNFNILVTDLFKIYKTRIWMSAVNPASLNAPVPLPRAIGPGAIGGRDSPMDPRPGLMRQSPSGGVGLFDPDPTGAIPPYQNPTTNAFYEYNIANRQSSYNEPSPPAQHGYAHPLPQAYGNQLQQGYDQQSYQSPNLPAHSHSPQPAQQYMQPGSRPRWKDSASMSGMTQTGFSQPQRVGFSSFGNVGSSASPSLESSGTHHRGNGPWGDVHPSGRRTSVAGPISPPGANGPGFRPGQPFVPAFSRPPPPEGVLSNGQ